MVEEALRQLPDFPPLLRDLVEHMILSHHGALEFGSPKVPMFPEAMLLHHIDNLDSKMEAMRAHIAKDRQANGVWTGYNPALERIVLKKQQYLSGAAGTERAAAAPRCPLPPSCSRTPSLRRPSPRSCRARSKGVVSHDAHCAGPGANFHTQLVPDSLHEVGSESRHESFFRPLFRSLERSLSRSSP